MAITVHTYPTFHSHLINGDIDLLTATIKVALGDNTHIFSLAHEFFNDVDDDEIAGTGYTAGGVTLASVTGATTLASALAAWAASTVYVEGDIVRPTVANGHAYLCVVGGTSAASEPTWPTVYGQDVTDSGATWSEFGGGFVAFDAADAEWNPLTASGIRHAWAYVAGASPGVDDYLISHIDLGQDENVSGSLFVVRFHDHGIVVLPFAAA